LELKGHGIFSDLNRDGIDDYIQYQYAPQDKRSTIYIFKNATSLVDEIHCNGRITYVTALDWNSDGQEEILHTFTRDDSAFLRIIDHEGNVLVPAKFLYKGQPRTDSTGYYEWMGIVKDIQMTDLDDDGRDELIITFSETYARYPRGLFVYDAATLHEKKRFLFGPSVLNRPILADVDGDGKKEIYIGTASPCNGARINGTDDFHSYVFVLDHNLDLKWQRIVGGRFTTAQILIQEPKIPGNFVLICLSREAGNISPAAYLEQFDPLTGKRLAAPFIFPAKTVESHALQWDNDPQWEFIFLIGKRKITILDDNLQTVAEKSYGMDAKSLWIVRDWNQDGKYEIACIIGDKWFLLGKNLNPIAPIPFVPTGDKLNYKYVMFFRMANRSPLLVTSDTGQNHTFLLDFLPNRMYFWQKYGNVFIWFVALSLIVGLGYLTVTTRHRFQFLKNLSQKMGLLSPYPLLIMDDRQQILFANASARELLGLENQHLPADMKTTLNHFPHLTDVFLELRFNDPMRTERDLVIPNLDNGFYHMVAEPVHHPKHSRPFWVISLHPKNEPLTTQNHSAWAAMAQRIAHDIKNPLTSIQLALQRLQMEYQDYAPQLAERLDPYVDRIIERIQSLRRLSRGFMKLINTEELTFEPLDLHQFLRELQEQSYFDLPSDIQLEIEADDNVPPAWADREQLQIVIENLVSNAVNAMKEGGKLTIRVYSPAREISKNDGKPSREYVVLEVRDTGHGIPDHLKSRLFTPYATGSRSGTGLGLVIVKKIVSDHDGYIEFETEVNKGTVFRVFLPVADHTQEDRPDRVTRQSRVA